MKYPEYFTISRFFFTDWIASIISIIALIIALKHHKERKELHLITHLLTADVLSAFISIYGRFVLNNMHVEFSLLSAIFLLRISLLTIFFKRIIKSLVAKKILMIFFIVYLLLQLIYWIKVPFHFWGGPGPLFSVGYLGLIIACLIYFYELFIISKPVMLKTNPYFWIATGVLLRCSSLALELYPFYLYWFKHKLPTITTTFNMIDAAVYVMEGILYLCFAKAYLCRQAVQKPSNL